MIHVVHVIHNLDRAGAQKSLASLLHGLAEEDGKHTVFAWKRSGPVAEEIEAAGIRVVQGPGRFLPAVRQLLALCDETGANIVHAHMEDAASLAFAASFLRPLSYFVTLHDGTKLLPEMPALKSAVRLSALKHAARRANKVLAVRDELRSLAVDTLGVQPTAFVALPACVRQPSAHDVNNAEEQRKAYRGPIRVVSVGRHVGLKRHDVLARAAQILGERGVACEVTILGDGPLLEENRALIECVKRPAQLLIPGATSDVAQVLAMTDVFVNTSEYEGTSMAVLEAMSWRVPVLVSDVPGNKELVEENVHGHRFPLDNPALLADLIERSGHADTAMVDAAQELVDGTYSAKHLAQRHLALYCEVEQPEPATVKRLRHA